MYAERGRRSRPPSRPRVRCRRPDRDDAGACSGLPLAWLVVFFLLPLALVAGVQPGRLLARPGDAPSRSSAGTTSSIAGYLRLFWKSMQLSLIVSAIVVALAYPVAYFLAMSGTKRKYVLLLILIAPFLTSYLLRVLAWKVILGNTACSTPSSSGRTCGRTTTRSRSSSTASSRSCSCSPTSGSLRRAADLRLAREPRPAAARGGDRSRRVPAAVVRPRDAAAVLPGVIAAFLFVFIPTVGEFVTPSLVGGTSGYLYGNQIIDLFGTGFPDWRTGSCSRSSCSPSSRCSPRASAVPAVRGSATAPDGRRALHGGRRVLACFFGCSSSSSTRRSAAAHLLVQRLGAAVVPAQRLHAPLVPRLPDDAELRGALETSAIVAALRASAPSRSAARVDRDRAAALRGKALSRRCCSARSSSPTSSSGSRCSSCSTRSGSRARS